MVQALTFSAVNLQVRGGQVVVHVMLVDFLKEALSLPELQVLSGVVVPNPLRVVCLRWPTKIWQAKKESQIMNNETLSLVMIV